MKCFLLVEDDPDDQQFFMDALHAVTEDVACYAVANGEEAIAILKQREFRPNVIFTDMEMPIMNGFDLLKTLKSNVHLKDIPVIIYSAAYSENLAKQAVKLGALAFYSKMRPADLPQILVKLAAEINARPTIL